METRITEMVPPSMYFKNNDYIDDGGAGNDPDEKELEPGFGDEELDGGASPGVGGDNDEDDSKGGMME